MKKCIICLLVVVPFITTAQSRAISGELFWVGHYTAYMVNFENLFLQKNRDALGFRVGFGNNMVNSNFQFFNIEGLYYRGGSHRLEVAPFFTYGEGLFLSENKRPMRELSVGLRTGYAYAPKSINLLFRIGFSTHHTSVQKPVVLSRKALF